MESSFDTRFSFKDRRKLLHSNVQLRDGIAKGRILESLLAQVAREVGSVLLVFREESLHVLVTAR